MQRLGILLLFLNLTFALPLKAQDSSTISQTQYTTPHSDLTLEVRFDGQSLTFLSQETELFRLRQDEIPNFLQIAHDLENFDQRLASAFEGLKITSSIVLGFGTGGISVGGFIITSLARFSISSAPLFLPEYQGDLQVRRLSESDLPYLLNPHHYSQWSLPKKDLDKLIEGLLTIHQEYDRRLTPLLKSQALIASQEGDPLQCQWPTSESIVIQYGSYVYSAKLDSKNDSIFAEIQLVEDSPDWMFENLHPFYGYKDPQATLIRLSLQKEAFAVLSMDLVSQYDLEFFDHYDLDEILANLGVRTRAVNANWISPKQSQIQKAYQIGLQLGQCLRQINP